MVKLSIDGMHCGSCAGRVEQSLKSVKGVTAVTVDLGGAQAEVAGEQLSVAALIAAVKSAGYDSRVP
ncbi:MAG: heavy metal-associated domain-containing protein [Alphaproteobacteria bacterium]|nr:heavy metal-associated domain-containing protein [Alphaproteobacteria bacterium]